eukprot:scaffold555_cov109-Isochrysis_galbana.AAC.4
MHVDCGDATHPVVGGGTHHRRATRSGLPSADAPSWQSWNAPPFCVCRVLLAVRNLVHTCPRRACAPTVAANAKKGWCVGIS